MFGVVQLQGWLDRLRPAISLRVFLLNGLSMGLVVALLMLIGSTLWRVWFNDPPIRLMSLEPVNLGQLCPGQDAPLHVHVVISEPIILHYFASVLDAEGKRNIIGTPRAWTDNLHPRPATFDESFPWIVPQLLPGRYRRVMAARNVSGNQNTVFIERFFEVPVGCPKPPIPH